MLRILRARTTWLVLLGVGLIGVAFYVWRRPAEVKPVSLRLSTGRITNPPNRMTQFFLDNGPKNSVHFDLKDVSGSEDSIDQVERGDLDLALVKGGIKLGDRKNVRQVTALALEYVHLLVRPELAQAVAADFAALRGKRINLNVRTTGTHHWTLDILEFMGLRPALGDKSGDFTPTYLGYPEILKLIDDADKAPADERRKRLAELPDAVFIIAPILHPAARRLTQGAGYHLIPLDFAPAYIQERNDDPQEHDVLDRNVMIEVSRIPAYTYGVTPPMPATPCTTLGFRRLLIANAGVSHEAIVRVLRMTFQTPLEPSVDPIDPSTFHPQYPFHPGVQVFIDEHQRVMERTIRSYTEKALSVAGAAIGGILALYGYFQRRKLLRFEHYYHEVQRINQLALGQVADASAPTDRKQFLYFLENKLIELRNGAIAEFAQRRLQGEALALSLFNLISDTSQSIASLLNRPESSSHSDTKDPAASAPDFTPVRPQGS